MEREAVLSLPYHWQQPVSHIPIIGLTAYAIRETKRKLLRLGAMPIFRSPLILMNCL